MKKNNDMYHKIYATSLFMKPLAKVQTLKVFIPNKKAGNGSSDASIGRMYQW